MDIALVSDLHLEHAGWRSPALPDDTLVIAAGDILPIGLGNAVKALAGIFKRQRCLYVPGNHDYYNREAVGGRVSMAEADARWREAAGKTGGRVVALIDETIDIDGVRFVGTPLFSDLSLENPVDRWFLETRLREKVPDFTMMAADGGRRWTVAAMQARHLRARAFLAKALDEARQQSKPAIAITHFPPSPRSLSPERNGSLRGYFANDLGDMLCDAAVWCHGHVHDDFAYTLPCDSRVYCNPRGYPFEHRRDYAPLVFSYGG